MIIELRNLIIYFFTEWKKIIIAKDKKLSKKVAKSNDDIHDLDEDEIF